LHVIGHNVAAQASCLKLGHQPTHINMFKTVGTETPKMLFNGRLKSLQGCYQIAKKGNSFNRAGQPFQHIEAS
jgi:hypothetical protein